MLLKSIQEDFKTLLIIYICNPYYPIMYLHAKIYSFSKIRKKKNALKSESLKIYFKKRIEYFPSLFIFEKSIDHPKSI